MTPLRLPLRALPLAIKATHLAANACAYAWAALADLHADLVALHEPQTVEDLTAEQHLQGALDHLRTTYQQAPENVVALRPAKPCLSCGVPCRTIYCGARCARAGLDVRCFECGTSDPTGFCPAHRVLDKGRVN